MIDIKETGNTINVQREIPTIHDGYDGEVVTGIISEDGRRLIGVKYEDGWFFANLDKLSKKKIKIKKEKATKSSKTTTTAGGSSLLNDLTDAVITGTPADNEVLAYDTSSSKWINQTAGEAGLSGSGVLNDLTDAVITGTPADNEVLAYDTSSSKWINQTAGEAGLTGGTGGHVIENAGAALTARANLNFDGTFLVATDNDPDTDVTVNGTAGGFDGDEMQIGTALTGLNASSASTTVRGALQSMDSILALLAPAKPVNLSTLSLSNSGYGSYYSAKKQTGGLEVANVHDSSEARLKAENFYDGDTGTLTAHQVAPSAVLTGGSIVISTGDDTNEENSANNMTLKITDDSDPYAGEAGKEGFYRQLSARIVITGLSSDQVGYGFKMVHTTTGETSIFYLFFDNKANTAPTVSAVALNGTPVIAGTTFKSGVSYMNAGDRFNATCTIADAVGNFYRSTNVGQCLLESTAGVTLSNTINYSPTGTLSTDPLTGVSFLNVQISSGKFSTNTRIKCFGFNARGSASDTSTTNQAFVVDSVSGTESDFRIRSGIGRNPVFGSSADNFGGTYISTVSIYDGSGYTEELQFSNGYFHYPTEIDWSAKIPVGPDYSSIDTDIVRRMCEYVGDIINVTSITIQINGADTTGFDDYGTQSSDDFVMQIKVIDDAGSDTTGWLDANTPYGGGSPSDDHDACLDLGLSDFNTKKCTFGSISRSGKVYVRIGWTNTGGSAGSDPLSSSTRRFTSLELL